MAVKMDHKRFGATSKVTGTTVDSAFVSLTAPGNEHKPQPAASLPAAPVETAHQAPPEKHPTSIASGVLHKIEAAASILKSSIKGGSPVPVRKAHDHIQAAKQSAVKLEKAQATQHALESRKERAKKRATETAHAAKQAASAAESAAASTDVALAAKAKAKSKRFQDTAHAAAVDHAKAVVGAHKAEREVQKHEEDVAVHLNVAKDLAVGAAHVSGHEDASLEVTSKKLETTLNKHASIANAKQQIVLKSSTFGPLKKMEEVDAAYPCVGIGTVYADGKPNLAAFKCKATPSGACPASLDTAECMTVPLDVRHLKFKPLF